MTSDHDPHSLIDSLRDLAQTEAELPPHLEERVVDRLRAARLLATPAPSRRRYVWLSVAATLFFAFGVVIGRSTKSDVRPAYTYVLLLEEGSSYRPAHNSDETQQRVREYSNFAKQLRAEGVDVMGMRLDSSAVMIDDRAHVSDDLAGLFAIRARDLESAKRIARRCPHLKYGGGVIVRPVAPT